MMGFFDKLPTFFCDQKKVAKKSPAVADAADPALGAARP